MKQHEEQFEMIDHVLATDEAIAPSSGFVATVMERVNDEAVRARKPLEFPWRRVLPGLALVGAVLVVTLVMALMPSTHAVAPSASFLPIPHQEFNIDPRMSVYLMQLPWLALAAGVSLFSWMLARRIVGLR